MDRRAFLTGLFGVTGAVALAGIAAQPAQAAPLARTLDAQPPAPDATDEVTQGLQTPDGTPVDRAQYYRHDWRRSRRRGRGRGRGRRRRSRLVCRNYRVRGRWVRRCRRVWYY